ncbi:MAG: DUF169 domain-containing protein [Candidatus Aminicenantales bacterium]
MSIKTPDSRRLCARIDYALPIIALYDAPDPRAFTPLIKPSPGDCVFSFYQQWLGGKTLHITRAEYGCGGAGRWLCGLKRRNKEDFLEFLVDGEGLKASRALMARWIDASRPPQREHPHILIGPLKKALWAYVKTVTFFVNPDQLSALMVGAQYFQSPEDPPPIIAPFGSGCMLLLPFEDLTIPQACIGATDIAMRPHIPPNILTFTATKPMFTNLCALDERSFLYKPFLKRLRRKRGLQ